MRERLRHVEKVRNSLRVSEGGVTFAFLVLLSGGELANCLFCPDVLAKCRAV